MIVKILYLADIFWLRPLAGLADCRHLASVCAPQVAPPAAARGKHMERMGKIVDLLVVSMLVLMLVAGLGSLLRF